MESRYGMAERHCTHIYTNAKKWKQTYLDMLDIRSDTVFERVMVGTIVKLRHGDVTSITLLCSKDRALKSVLVETVGKQLGVAIPIQSAEIQVIDILLISVQHLVNGAHIAVVKDPLVLNEVLERLSEDADLPVDRKEKIR
jgi:hypothetical protein